jgi:hypothetical protein
MKMNCGRCGAENPEGSRYCQRCGCPIGDRPSPPGAPQNVPNYLVPAILVTLCCCLPFGIVALVYSASVNSRLIAGDYEGALRASRAAAGWCWAAFISGLLLIVMALGLFIVAILSAVSSGGSP